MHYIGGHWKNGNGNTFTSIDPSTSDTLWEGCAGTKEEVEWAVKASQNALAAWRSQSFEFRAQAVEAFISLLIESQDALAEAIAKEVGKPLWDAKGEVAAMIGKGRISIQACKDRYLPLSSSDDETRRVTRYKPHGIAAVLGPFNFPGHLPNGHIIPALLAGNCVVFKPSELTPLVAERMVEIWHRSGLPKGVLNMIQGGSETGQFLGSHPLINALFFTGSDTTGKALSEAFASQPGKILALEMGGNNPLIVSKITDVKAAVLTTLQSAFITSGQRCTCARRLILIHDETPNEFLEMLIHSTEKIGLGSWRDIPEPFMGPMISIAHAEKVAKQVEALKNRGAKLLTDFKKFEAPFHPPVILDLSDAEGVPDEEIFGPVLSVYWVKDLDQAIQEANTTRFGLSASLLSDSKEEYERFKDGIRAGIVNWNIPTTGASSAMPFGGIGESGNGRPSAYFAADYCAYPVASMEQYRLKLPSQTPPGITL